MQYFEQYSSNTIAGSANQHYFIMGENEVRTGRVFYKITHGGTYRYSLLFSNILDSTYADGSVSIRNLICDPWMIHRARIGVCKATVFDVDPTLHSDKDVLHWADLSFGGCFRKTVAAGEFFWSDPIEMTFECDEYLCLEMTYSGKRIPYHEESLLPVFACKDGKWEYDRKMPYAGMVGCDRKVGHRIGFWGDSITQGIGTPMNSYAHWNARLAKMLGDDVACWNLGIGYARANDAATLSAWWQKAVHNDIVVLCLGANDVLQWLPEEQIKTDLLTIVTALKEHGIRVVLQTVPPFEYAPALLPVWKNVNAFIHKELACKVDLLFDMVPYLSNGEPDFLPLYNSHPNADGCKIWADALFDHLKELL